MKKLMILLMCLPLLAACTSEEPSLAQQVQTTAQHNTMFKVSPDAAIAIADYYVGNLDDTNTRSNRSVSSIEIVRNDGATRSAASAPDTLLYIVNYDDGQGFAIVGADTRAYPIYAMSDTDNFEITDSTNPNVIEFLEFAKNNVAEQASDNLSPNDFNLPTTPTRPTPFPYINIPPMVSARQSRIGPSSELCKYVVNDAGEQSLTCCVPIAVEIAMSYHKWPVQLEGYTFDWDSMNAGTNDDGIARMLAILSSPEYCHVEGNDAEHIGYSYTSLTIPTLRKAQYKFSNGSPKYVTFGTQPVNQDIINLLKNNGPILIDGRLSKPEYSGGGHLWVIDGLRQTHCSVNVGSLTKLELFNMYHCIWGDDGRCNGYYLAQGNIFDGEPDSYDPIDPGRGSEGYDWRYFKNMIYFGDFTPNK